MEIEDERKIYCKTWKKDSQLKWRFRKRFWLRIISKLEKKLWGEAVGWIKLRLLPESFREMKHAFRNSSFLGYVMRIFDFGFLMKGVAKDSGIWQLIRRDESQRKPSHPSMISTSVTWRWSSQRRLLKSNMATRLGGKITKQRGWKKHHCREVGSEKRREKCSDSAMMRNLPKLPVFKLFGLHYFFGIRFSS